MSARGVGSERTGIAVVDFLLDRLNEDHDTAWGAAPSPWTGDERRVLDRHGDVTAATAYGGTLGHILRFDPTAVLRDIDAKRAAVLRCARVESLAPSSHLAFGVLWELAQAYREHPSFREEWSA